MNVQTATNRMHNLDNFAIIFLNHSSPPLNWAWDQRAANEHDQYAIMPQLETVKERFPSLINQWLPNLNLMAIK